MFPNPQDALPLPPNPSLEHYRKVAKNLVKICEADTPGGIRDWSAAFVEDLVKRSRVAFAPNLPIERAGWVDGLTEFATRALHKTRKSCTLSTAQFVIARALGFISWPRFVQHLEGAAPAQSSVAAFEAAADAIVSGDLIYLQELLRQYTDLPLQRSLREHHATLLHYTAANGIEGYRQKTPQNIVAIAQLLLESGAEVDAEADVYGGGCTTLGLAATSIHPEVAGVMEPLLELLLTHGARPEQPTMEQPDTFGNGQGPILGCLSNGRVRSAVFFANRQARLNLETAAGVGRLDVVKTYFDANGALLPSASPAQRRKGFIWACMYGWEEVALYLLDHGADLLDRADSGATPLHWAAGGASVGVVKALIARGAPLEEVNQWGGTVLGHAGHGFDHYPSAGDFVPTFETLLTAGAKIQGNWLAWIASRKHYTDAEKARVSEVFRRHGATT
jgi:ankyrin repeat protein